MQIYVATLNVATFIFYNKKKLSKNAHFMEQTRVSVLPKAHTSGSDGSADTPVCAICESPIKVIWQYLRPKTILRGRQFHHTKLCRRAQVQSRL